MAKPPSGLHDFKSLLEIANLSDPEKALIMSRIGENEKSRLLGGVTRHEFESMAKGLMFEAPGGPSAEKLKSLQLAVQTALEKANLIKEAGLDKRAAEAQLENADLAAKMTSAKGKSAKGSGKGKLDKTLIENDDVEMTATEETGADKAKVETGSASSGFAHQTKRQTGQSEADVSAAGVEDDRQEKRRKLAERQKEMKDKAETHSESGNSVKIGTNTIEFEHMQTAVFLCSKKYETKPLKQISGLRSTHSIIKNTESGRQQGRMNVVAVGKDIWQADERRNCWYNNDRIFHCVEMSTTYEHRSRLDDPPHSAHVSTRKPFTPDEVCVPSHQPPSLPFGGQIRVS